MRKKRFKNWHPKVGERALVPGGPACKAYVDALSPKEVVAIEEGYPGYLPLIIQITYINHKNKSVEFIAHATYVEKYQHWSIGSKGNAKNFASILRGIKSYYGIRNNNELFIDVPMWVVGSYIETPCGNCGQITTVYTTKQTLNTQRLPICVNCHKTIYGELC